jgi:hypothetical protein
MRSSPSAAHARPCLAVRPALSLPLLAAIALLGACDELPFTPSSLIDKPRIVAVAADPPVIAIDGDGDGAPDGAATLTALVVTPDGRDSSVAPDQAVEMDVRWRACNPWKPVFEPERDCGPDDALPLAAADGDTWQAQAEVRVADVLTRFPPPPEIIDQIGGQPGGQPGGEPGGEPPDPDACPHSYEYALLPVVVEVTVGEERLLAIQRVRVTWQPVGRRAPALGALVVDDEAMDPGQPVMFTPGAEHSVSVSMDSASLDPVCLDDDPEQPNQIALEPVHVHAYVTAGELDEHDIDVEYTADGTEHAVTRTWTAPPSGDVTAWLVATDSDGGVTWARFALQPR